jgi:hypothetical protein
LFGNPIRRLDVRGEITLMLGRDLFANLTDVVHAGFRGSDLWHVLILCVGCFASPLSMSEPASQFGWVFNGGGGRFPSGVFSTREKAEAWINQHGLSGVLTKYPLDEGAWDWAI